MRCVPLLKMKRFQLLILFAFFFNYLIAQSIQSEFENTIVLTTDTFRLSFSNSDHIFSFHLGEDTLDMGTGGGMGLSATLFLGNDSLVIPYTNLPFEQIIYFKIKGKKDSSVYRLHFNSVRSAYDLEYIKKSNGKVFYEIPEIYELANIIWTLSPSGKRSNNLFTSSSYYDEIVKFFEPVSNHKVLGKLNFPDSLYFQTYYDFRENSFPYEFENNSIKCNGPYYYIWGENNEDYKSTFSNLISEIEDFAKASNFREFYHQHQPYYQQLIERQQELMPINEMWEWLETQFPNRHFNSYKIVFSPLIGGSHSTQNFSNYFKNFGWFKESVMFINSPERIDSNVAIAETQKSGLMSGIVFTEIDHNYVNPESFQYRSAIDSIFGNLSFWKSAKNTGYNNPMAIFNEYMTHAIFCLWVNDHFNPEDARFINKKRIELNQEFRGLLKFEEFTTELVILRTKYPSLRVSELYPEMIKWCRTQTEHNK